MLLLKSIGLSHITQMLELCVAMDLVFLQTNPFFRDIRPCHIIFTFEELNQMKVRFDIE